ncbi:hypothetical protein RhiirA5_430658 [Rhizophagus irregularis]|uniref:Uncharacterized protein n=1 Tax=Rhizophagus irregularis TaxID=588596 RepID=A0A2I1FMW5_9GLOM|nr:hypothetical protein RhiirA5_430658 [Rhizophagus irregularis]PKY35703.1 hypothetical protein RhiirB3_456924 [Rhizophagus irregularis]GET57654.1 uncharacterized protein LOC107483170 [Rhizophagus irregularis DAOM 181602=DAOM 197198]
MDRTLRDITCINKPLGGKVFVFEVMKLFINMKLYQDLDPQEIIKQKKFAKFLLNIGDGNYSIVPGTENSINLPLNLMMTKVAGETSVFWQVGKMPKW